MSEYEPTSEEIAYMEEHHPAAMTVIGPSFDPDGPGYEIGTDEDGACLACGTPLQLCGHSEEAEHARICSLPFGHQGGHWWDDEQEPPPIGARCADPDCDGEAGHDGPHFQWVPE